MAESFDPYLRWLGIRESQRPPNHYRLLGLDLFESDSDVIAVAADRQMAHLRTFQTGQYAASSQRLLNELAAARICLLKPEKKAAYDALLKKQLAANAAAPSQPKAAAAAKSSTPVPVARATESTPANAATGKVVAANNASDAVGAGAASGEPADDFLDFASLGTNSASRSAGAKNPLKSASRRSSASRKRKSLVPWIALPIAGVLLVAAVIAIERTNEPASVASNDGTDPSASAGKQSTNSPAEPSNSLPPASSKNHLPRPSSLTPSPSPPLAPRPSPLAPNLPPQPPVHPPRDVALVENPPQHDSPDTAPVRPEPRTPNPEPRAPNPEPRAPNPGPRTDTLAPQPTVAAKPIIVAKSIIQPPADQPPAKPALPPVPDKEALAAAERTVLSIYKTDIEQANRGNSEAKASLAKQFIARGVETSDNTAARYALLTRARDLAIAAGDVAVASDAVKKLSAMYAIDRPEEQLAACFAGLAKTVRSRDAADALRSAAEEAADRAFAADDFEIAARFARLATGMATKLRDQYAVAVLKAKLNEIEQCKKDYGRLSDSLARLKTDPDDAEANLAVGRFFALVKGDFDKALPYLAKSSDTTLKELANRDLAAPTDPADQAKLGDAWWTLAESNRELAKSHLQAHAADWYSKAAPKLKGLAKGEVEARLKEVENSGHPIRTINRAQIVRVLTEGVWSMHFLPNPAGANATDVHGWDYPRYHFFEDGTAKAENAPSTGHWTLDGDVVSVRYDSVRPGDGWDKVLQKYRLVGDSLRAESYRLPDLLQVNRGTGTKIK